MDASTESLFTIDDQLIGYPIFKWIEDSASTQKSDAEIDLMYIQWMSIKQTNNESIRAFAARVQKYAAQFYGTDYEVNPQSLARRWHKGIGYDF